MKPLEQKQKNGSARGRVREDSMLSKVELPALPDGIPLFPSVIMGDEPQYVRTREIYAAIAGALTEYGKLHQQIDATLILMAATNYKIYEDCLGIALDPTLRFIEEAKSHTSIDPTTGMLATVLKEHPAMKLQRDSEVGFRNAMNALGLTVAKRASILGVLSLYQSVHTSGQASDPFAKFFVSEELQA